MNAITLSPVTARKPVPFGEHKRVALVAYTALSEMCNGTARIEEFHDLCATVNIVEALATMEKYDMAIVRPLVDTAIAGLEVAIKCPSGMMRMGASATAAMRHLVVLHDQAIAKFGRGTMYDADALVLRKIAEGPHAQGLTVVQA